MFKYVTILHFYPYKIRSHDKWFYRKGKKDPSRIGYWPGNADHNSNWIGPMFKPTPPTVLPLFSLWCLSWSWQILHRKFESINRTVRDSSSIESCWQWLWNMNYERLAELQCRCHVFSCLILIYVSFDFKGSMSCE